MNYTRTSALEIMQNGSTKEQLQLFFTEAELFDLGNNDEMRLTIDELGQLRDIITKDNNDTFEYISKAYNNIWELSLKTNYYIEILKKEKNNCFIVINAIAMAETLETAVNIALDNIDDADKRSQVADGIASHTTMFGCTLDTHLGYLRVNTEAKNIPNNLEKMRVAAINSYNDALVNYKSINKAINDFIDSLDIKLDNIKDELKRDYDSLEEILSSTLPKFTNKQQSAINKFAPAPDGVQPMLTPYATMVDWYETKANRKRVDVFMDELKKGLDN